MYGDIIFSNPNILHQSPIAILEEVAIRVTLPTSERDTFVIQDLVEGILSYLNGDGFR